jgi:hypothetical protein
MAGEARALLVEGEDRRFLLPLVRRSFDPTTVALESPALWDAISPYGYPGPLILTTGSDETKTISDAVEAATPVLREMGCVSVFVRLNPILNAVGSFARSGVLVGHGDSVWLDLTLSADELQNHVRPRFRSYINALIRDGVTARFDEDWSHIGTFVSLYHQTMNRVGAAGWYYFDREYFESLRAILGEQIKLCLVEANGKIAAAGLFAVTNGIVQYLFSGTDESVAQPHATKLMMVHVRDWARAQGHSIMHLGGGFGGRSDNLAQFKRGFSKLSKPFYTWRWIVDPKRYEALVQHWRETHDLPADGPDGFFPAYRKPVATVIEDEYRTSNIER